MKTNTKSNGICSIVIGSIIRTSEEIEKHQMKTCRTIKNEELENEEMRNMQIRIVMRNRHKKN